MDMMVAAVAGAVVGALLTYLLMKRISARNEVSAYRLAQWKHQADLAWPSGNRSASAR